MAIISKTILLSIADRASEQYRKVSVAFDTINNTGAEGNYFDRVIDSADPDVVVPLVSSYNSADTNLTLNTTVKNGMSVLTNVVSVMDNHFNRVNHTGSWDGFLTDNDERVSDYFNQLYYASKGTYMKANNVFSEDDDTLGTAEVVVGPSVDFTDGVTYGDGSSSNLANGSYFAATQLKVEVDTVGGAGTGMAADLDLTIVGKDEDNAVKTADVTIPAGLEVGDSVDIGTTADLWLDITSVDFTSLGDQGMVGDEVSIHNIKERAISL